MPGALLSACIERVDGEIVVGYLTHRDHGWLGRVLEEHEAHVGRRKIELDRRFSELMVPSSAKPKLRLALRVLDRLARTKTDATVSPKEARATTFRAAAAANGSPRADVLERAALALGVTPDAVEAALFADLPSERRVCSLGAPAPAALAEEVNTALVTALVARAVGVRIRVWGDARPLVRHARRSGLICVARRASREELVLEISGPAALFRKTAIYGRALGSLVSRLRLCERFELRAVCSVPRSDETAVLVLTSAELVSPADEIRAPDDRIERRFARDFERYATDWELEREPAAIEVEGVSIFPDFELRRREQPAARWLLEIVGFWTPEYLTAKLERLSASGERNCLLCVDSSRSCGEGDLPDDPRIQPYSKRIDPRQVLDAIEALSSAEPS